MGCLYKHPNMDVLDFKNNYLNQIFRDFIQRIKTGLSSWRL